MLLRQITMRIQVEEYNDGILVQPIIYNQRRIDPETLEWDAKAIETNTMYKDGQWRGLGHREVKDPKTGKTETIYFSAKKNAEQIISELMDCMYWSVQKAVRELIIDTIDDVENGKILVEA